MYSNLQKAQSPDHMQGTALHLPNRGHGSAAPSPTSIGGILRRDLLGDDRFEIRGPNWAFWLGFVTEGIATEGMSPELAEASAWLFLALVAFSSLPGAKPSKPEETQWLQNLDTIGLRLLTVVSGLLCLLSLRLLVSLGLDRWIQTCADDGILMWLVNR